MWLYLLIVIGGIFAIVGTIASVISFVKQRIDAKPIIKALVNNGVDYEQFVEMLNKPGLLFGNPLLNYIASHQATICLIKQRDGSFRVFNFSNHENIEKFFPKKKNLKVLSYTNGYRAYTQDISLLPGTDDFCDQDIILFHPNMYKFFPRLLTNDHVLKKNTQHDLEKFEDLLKKQHIDANYEVYGHSLGVRNGLRVAKQLSNLHPDKQIKCTIKNVPVATDYKTMASDIIDLLEKGNVDIDMIYTNTFYHDNQYTKDLLKEMSKVIKERSLVDINFRKKMERMNGCKAFKCRTNERHTDEEATKDMQDFVNLWRREIISYIIPTIVMPNGGNNEVQAKEVKCHTNGRHKNKKKSNNIKKCIKSNLNLFSTQDLQGMDILNKK